MKVKLRAVSVLLALLMLVSALSACGGEQIEKAETEGAESMGSVSETETVTETRTETEAMPEVEKTNYNSDFYLSIKIGRASCRERV